MIVEFLSIKYFGSFHQPFYISLLSVNFDYISPYYSLGEKYFFGEKLNFHRRLFPHTLRISNKVLLLGEGRGKFLQYLLKENNSCKITIIESSKRMAESIYNLIPHRDRFRVEIKNISIKHFKSDHRFDLICSFFFWDCFSEYQLNHHIPLMIDFLGNKGYWHNADFVDVSKINCYQTFKNFIFIRSLYLLFNYTTGLNVNKVFPVCSLILNNNMRLIRSVESSNKLLKSDLFRKTAE